MFVTSGKRTGQIAALIIDRSVEIADIAIASDTRSGIGVCAAHGYPADRERLSVKDACRVERSV
jgi:hypothetical protein